MIHYHGGPCPGTRDDNVKFFKGRDCLLSYAYKDAGDEQLLFEVCRTFILDNGAFTVWRNGGKLDIDGFYSWVDGYRKHPRFEWFLIPDVIGGTESENDRLVASCKTSFDLKHQCCPVFHLGERLERFNFFHELGYRRVALGSANGIDLKSTAFWNEMRKIFHYLDKELDMPFKVHGLRMLDPEIVSSFPFSSGDSSTASRNAIADINWKHRYSPISKASRAALVAEYLERAQSPSGVIYKPLQTEMDLCSTLEFT